MATRTRNETAIGYDPTQEDGGVSPQAEPAKRAAYFSAEATCLKARGYSVR